MQPNPFLGVFFHWLGGLASGSFYVPYRGVKKWAWEVGAFFQGVGADAPDEDLRRIAPLHPIFRISHHP